jgi:flagellar motor switch protein FliN
MSSSSAAAGPRTVPVAALDKVPVKLEAYLGTVQTTVGELSSLKTGDLLRLDASPGDPVELLLNDVTIAWGELVTVGENLAVRIRAIAD